MKTGFTLIELLVVVLIIGILAAIALPQYQKAVERSRMAEALQVLGDFANAESIYYMQHNEFARTLNGLNEGDITIPTSEHAFEYTMPERTSRNMTSLSAERQSGMYEGGTISIYVRANGSIRKECQDPAGKTGFCTLAEAAGYETIIAEPEAENVK